ncbi:peroxiredoxin-like 2C isoform X3 [Microtus pennsylvanicus]|uniref:peroxiredoxin-like 2C isoform X3 n=1 Tax=Microtus pennsylvanicus TaxID=10058 RepID=UPI003F6C8DFC
MAAPVTRQVSGCAGPVLTPTCSDTEPGQPLAAAVADLPVLDASGRRVSFGALFRERRAVVVFVRHFLCYVCKEYVEDLAKIPKSFLREADVTLIVIGQSSYHHIEPFCKLTGYSHEIYVDPEREIYKRLGMKRGEEISSSESGKDDGPNTECFQTGEMMAQPLGARTALVKDPRGFSTFFCPPVGTARTCTITHGYRQTDRHTDRQT